LLVSKMTRLHRGFGVEYLVEDFTVRLTSRLHAVLRRAVVRVSVQQTQHDSLRLLLFALQLRRQLGLVHRGFFVTEPRVGQSQMVVRLREIGLQRHHSFESLARLFVLLTLRVNMLDAEQRPT